MRTNKTIWNYIYTKAEEREKKIWNHDLKREKKTLNNWNTTVTNETLKTTTRKETKIYLRK